MRFAETPLAGAYVIDVDRFEDERGCLSVAWKQDEAEAHGINTVFNRANIASNHKAGTLRGLHAQKEPYGEAKLVRCIRGAVFDAIVDIRPASSTFGQWFGVELDTDNQRMLYVPSGFLHGFQTLRDDTQVFYQIAGTYRPDQETGARFDDPVFKIAWPETPERILSPKDQQWPRFESLVQSAT